MQPLCIELVQVQQKPAAVNAGGSNVAEQQKTATVCAVAFNVPLLPQQAPVTAIQMQEPEMCLPGCVGASITRPAVATMTPSKRRVMDGAIDLKDVFQRGFQLFLDPECPSPLRRELNALLVQSAKGIDRKCAEHTRNSCRTEQVENFDCRSGHVYDYHHSPARHQSAAERGRNRKDLKADEPRARARVVPLETGLAYGLGDDIPVSDLQKAMNERRKAHSFKDRRNQWISKQRE
jgi:hypothetical protein